MRGWKLLLSLLMMASFFLTIIALQSRNNSFPIQFLIINTLAPFQRAIMKGVDAAGDVWRGYIYLVGVSKENVKLYGLVKELQGEVMRLREGELRLRRLQRLTGFIVEQHIEAVPAEVVGREATNWSRMILLNRGSEDGVEKDMAVVTSEGLVGRVMEVVGNKSKVLLMTDWRSSVDSLIHRSRVRGVVVGKSHNESEMKYIPLEADVRVGDKVITSGLGGVYSKGLVVGTVMEVVRERNGLYQKASVVPAVDTAQVEEALVILRYGE